MTPARTAGSIHAWQYNPDAKRQHVSEMRRAERPSIHRHRQGATRTAVQGSTVDLPTWSPPTARLSRTAVGATSGDIAGLQAVWQWTPPWPYGAFAENAVVQTTADGDLAAALTYMRTNGDYTLLPGGPPPTPGPPGDGAYGSGDYGSGDYGG